MNARDVYHDLLKREVKLSIQGELLAFSAPKGALTPELLSLLKKHKQALIELIKDDAKGCQSPFATYLASYGQEALWLLHQTQPTSSSYHTAAALRLMSHVDGDAMQRALNKLVLRHEALRTSFEQRELKLYSRVQENAVADFATIDASRMDASQLHTAIEREYATPFDLEKGPLFRTRLFSQTETCHVILLTLHHIVFDATSLWVLQSELQALYSAEVTGTPALLPVLEATYKDFVGWQRALPDSNEGKKQWAYWANELSGDPTPAELVWSFPRPATGERNAATYSCPMDEQLGHGLRSLAKSLAATPFATAMAVFQTLLFRYSGQRDFIVGITTNGRSQSRFDKEIGYFVNVLPIRVEIGNKTTFTALVNQTKHRLIGAMQSSDFPFPLLVQRLNPVRASNAAPLCRTVFGLQKPHAFSEVSQLLDNSDETISWGGLQAQSYKLNQQEGQFDLALELYESAQSFTCVLKYDRNLLTEDSAVRLTNHFQNLLREIIENPDRELEEFKLMESEESAQLERWATGGPIKLRNGVTSVHEDFLSLWNRSVSEHAQAVALTFGERAWTYLELDHWANAVSNCFQQAGVLPGDRIVVATTRQPLVPVCLLAALKCGAAYVPVAPTSPASRLVRIVEECEPKVIVSQMDPNELAACIETFSVRLLQPSALHEALLFAQTETNTLTAAAMSESQTTNRELESSYAPDSAAYIIYTSGSSGFPKGVEVSRAAIAMHVQSMAQVYNTVASDRVMQFCDITFDPSVEQFLTPWSVGAGVVMRTETMYTGDSFWQEVKDKCVTIANVPPSFFIECTHFLKETHGLRLVIVGGDVFPGQTLSKWKDTGVRLLNAYGPTEAVITATTQEVLETDAIHRITIGSPKPGSTAHVLNSMGHQSPIGVPGELVLGGPMLATGYVGDAKDTNQRFQLLSIGNLPAERVYRTGDVARWTDNGQLEFLGRSDRQIKIRGFRVEPGEIEAALLKVPGIKDALVLLAEENKHQYLGAYMLVENGIEISREILSLHLKSHLPMYMLPERFAFLTEWPLNDSGKIAIRQLPELPRPDANLAQRYVPARSKLEEAMVMIWEEVLDVERVGIFDDFYQLGGGSLQSLRIISRLRECGISVKDTSIEMSPHLLFQYVTIAELSGLLLLASCPNTENSGDGPITTGSHLLDSKTPRNDTMSSIR